MEHINSYRPESEPLSKYEKTDTFLGAIAVMALAAMIVYFLA